MEQPRAGGDKDTGFVFRAEFLPPVKNAKVRQSKTRLLCGAHGLWLAKEALSCHLFNLPLSPTEPGLKVTLQLLVCHVVILLPPALKGFDCRCVLI